MAEKIESRCAGIPQNLKEGVRDGCWRELRFQNGSEVIGIFVVGGFGSIESSGRVAQARGTRRGEGVVIGTQQAGGSVRGFHFGKNGGEGGGKTGSRNQGKIGFLVLHLQERWVNHGLEGNENSLLVGYRLIEGVDGRVIQSRIGANGFGKLSRSNGRDKDLDLAFELLMFRPVEATERVGARRGEQSVGAKRSARKIFH